MTDENQKMTAGELPRFRYSRLAIWVLSTVAMTFFVHEAAHGITSYLLGYKTYIQINSSGLESGEYRSQLDADVTTAAGPFVTLIQAILGMVIAIRWKSIPAMTIVQAALMMRVLATVASLRTPNDEARLGLSWGLGYWTLHAIMLIALLIIFVRTAIALRSKSSNISLNFVMICFSMIAVVIAEPFLPIIRL